jgi:hypothetical protein
MLRICWNRLESQVKDVRQIEGGNNRQMGDSHALMKLVLMIAWQLVLTVCKRFGLRVS